MVNAFIGIGSYEQHGKLLPENTDSLIAEYFSKQLTQIFKGLLYPTFPYGLSTEHRNYSNTVTVDVFTMTKFLSVLFRSIRESSLVKNVFIINGHGGNKSMLDLVSTQLNYEKNKKKVFLLDLYTLNIQQKAEKLFECFDTHAGSAEASLVSFIKGYIENKIVTNNTYIKKISGGLQLFTTDRITQSGIISDINKVEFNKGKGEEYANEIERSLINQVKSVLSRIEEINET